MTSHPTRRQALLSLGLAGAVGLGATGLAGCGDSSASGGSGSSSGEGGSARLPEGEGTTTYPLELKSPYGTTTLEKRPERIAVVSGIQDFEAVAALGVVPVISDTIDWEWKKEAVKGHEVEEFDVWSDDGLPFEKILAAKPDVIMATTYGNLEKDYKRLSQIAPVVTMESYEETNSWEFDWREIIRRVATALDLEDAAETVVKDTDAAVAQAAKDHPEWKGTSLTFLMNRGEEAGLSVPNYDGSVVEEVATSLGFAKQPKAKELAKAEGEVSVENIRMLEADVIVVVLHGGHGTPEAAQKWLEDNSVYQSLDAVKKDRVALVKPTKDGDLPMAWAFDYPNGLSTPWMLEHFAAAVDPVLA